MSGWLFDAPSMALQVWRLAPPCSYGVHSLWGSSRAVGWVGPHHCWYCAVATAEARAAFDAAVARGEYDEHGYTPQERKKQLATISPSQHTTRSRRTSRNAK